MNGPFSKLCIVPAVAAFLMLGASSGQALAPEGNCCFTVTSGSTCGPLNQEDCEDFGGTFLGSVPCPPPDQPCPEVGNCKCPPEEGDEGFCGGPIDRENCEFSGCVFLDDDPCPEEQTGACVFVDEDGGFEDCIGEKTESDCDAVGGLFHADLPCSVLGNCCCNTFPAGNVCSTQPRENCEEFSNCVFLGGQPCPPLSEFCPSATPPGIVPVTADIKPGSCASPINPASEGTFPVTFFATQDFECGTFSGGDIAARRLDGVGDSVSPINARCEDVGGPGDPSSCDAGAEDYDLFADGFVDLTAFFSAAQAAEAWQLAQLSHDAKLALVLTGPLVRDGNVTVDEHFVSFATITKVGPQCSPCEALQGGQCVSRCPEDQVCVVTNNFTGAVSTTSAEGFETTSGDIATGPGECLTPCTSVLDCFAVTRCEDCVDGFCRSRCPGKCDDTPQPCSECDGAGTCNLCCEESRICPPLAIDCRFCCPEGDICRDGQCLRPCDFDSDCGDISNCEECRDGACVSKCVPPEVCIIGICMNPFQG